MGKFVYESTWNFTKIKWLDKYMVGHTGFIAGGCFKNIFNNEKVKDVDMFFENIEEEIKAEMYFEENKDYDKYYKNNKVTAFKDKETGVVVELVKSVFGSAEKIISEFDFTIVKFAYYKHKEKDENGEEKIDYECVYHPKYFEHLVMKRIVLDDKIPFPISSFERMLRYTKYGYYPCRETKKKLLEEIYNMPEFPDVTLSLYDGLD